MRRSRPRQPPGRSPLPDRRRLPRPAPGRGPAGGSGSRRAAEALVSARGRPAGARSPTSSKGILVCPAAARRLRPPRSVTTHCRRQRRRAHPARRRRPLAQLGVRRGGTGNAARRPGLRARGPDRVSFDDFFSSPSASHAAPDSARPGPQDRRSRPVPRLASEPEALNADRGAQRPQPQPAGAAGAGSLRPDDAGRDRGDGPRRRPVARRRHRVVPDQPRGRAGRRGAGAPRAGGRRADQRRRAHALEPGAPRRAAGRPGPLRRAAPLQHLRA